MTMKTEEPNIPPFSSDEHFYKEAFLKYPEAHLDRAQSIRAIEEACPEADRHLKSMIGPRRPADDLMERNLPDILDVTVSRHQRYAPAFLHSHTFFEVVCVFSGECENIFSSDTLRMRTDDICIIAPGTVHALSAFHDDCIVYNFLIRSGTFEQTFLNSLPKQGILYSFFTKALFRPGEESYLYFKNDGKPRDPELFRIFRSILREYNDQKTYYTSMLNALLTTFFIQLLRKHEKDVIVPNPSGKKQEENMIFILKYIDLHADTLTLKELSDFFNYSERQMARILKDYTGQTFTGLVQSTRMTKACRMLKHPDIPISDIIEAAGYSNASHFYDVFKKIYGMTPAQYRKQYMLREETNVL